MHLSSPRTVHTHIHIRRQTQSSIDFAQSEMKLLHYPSYRSLFYRCVHTQVVASTVCTIAIVINASFFLLPCLICRHTNTYVPIAIY